MSNADDLGPQEASSLGFLLQHAHAQLDALATEALEPFGVDPRSLGVLRVLASREATSQQEVAQLLGVDRTTMVALLDGLEERGVVSRRPAAGDRRRNVVELTEVGVDVFRHADATSMAVESKFLSRIDASEAVRVRLALHDLVAGPPSARPSEAQEARS